METESSLDKALDRVRAKGSQESRVRHATINDLPLSRSVDEAMRVLDALQHHQKHGEVCPANWAEGVARYLA